MKRLVLFAMALAAVCIMPSCGKDPKPNDNDEPTAEKITFGNYEGMDVVKYDNIEWDYYEESGVMSYNTKDFDVNGDGINDFYLTSIVSISPYQHDERTYTITLRSSKLEFHSQRSTIEVYRHLDSTIIHTDSIPLIYIDEVMSCGKVDESDIFEEMYSRRGVKIHSKDDVLNMNDSIFVATMDGGYLYESSVHFPYYMDLEVTEATVYRSIIEARDECFNLPLEEEVYVGFKYVDENGARLGWIKLIVEYDANGNLIARPLEAAIQKEYME